MKTDDRELIVVMKRYFAVKAELATLTAELEAERKAAGAQIGVFYDPRQNAERAADLQRSHHLKAEMASGHAARRRSTEVENASQLPPPPACHGLIFRALVRVPEMVGDELK
ncbi:hypothetical protein [Ensifer sp. ENS10]|uniref:hypothetical protein n=1 Tax=Ensifer sp. ENS10 TaxID=2769286 RepID=UPI0035C8531B